MYQLLESILIECEVHFGMQEESIDEILDGLTETFDRSEKRRFAEKVEKPVQKQSFQSILIIPLEFVHV